MARATRRSLRVLVVGSGPGGRRRVRHLKALGVADVAVARRPGADLGATEAELGVPAFAGLDAAEDWNPDAVVVANPPSEHVATALWAVRRGCSVLVEKPLANRLDAVDELIGAAEGAGIHLAVGYNLRFHPALRAIEQAVAGGRIGRLLSVRAEVGSYLPRWHEQEDYRSSSAARRDLGGGSLLTLVHELDYVLWIAGPVAESSGVRAKVSSLAVDADDVAEVVLRLASGALASVHMDFVDHAYNRGSRWVGDAGTIAWSWNGPVRLLGPEEATLWDDPDFDLEETYLAELAAFLRSEPPPGDGVGDARRALEIVASVPLA